MARTLWRLRRGTDHPRPAGRRWAGRLRRPRVLARRGRHAHPYRADGATEPHRVYPLQRAPHPDVRARPATGVRPEGPATTDHGDAGRAARADSGRAGHAGAVGADSGDRVAGAPEDAPPPSPTGGLLPGERTLGRRLRFVVANLCTVASLSLGVMAILLAMREDVRLAALCLIACVIFDGLDGTIARRLGVASPFGAQMDSLADLCAFGIAAPVVLYASLLGSVPRPAAALACTAVAVGAAIRLARFNVTPHDRRFFHGVPTTAVAAVLAVAALIQPPIAAPLQLLGMALLAVAMVSSFPYATVGRLLRLPGWLWLLPLAGLLLDPQATFLVLVGVYLASGPLVWLHRRRAA
ncbi:MAG TPA: CDP-alcohol phosphatidyltransferase family protein [Natronosporangium sp.]|nr:CDP-alcohol phosphatidyltransferase family protein [Natronosporangium sp.]